MSRRRVSAAAILNKLRRSSSTANDEVFVEENDLSQDLIRSVRLVLRDSSALAHFINFADGRGDLAQLDFWLRLVALCEDESNHDATLRRDDSLGVFNRFLAIDAPNRILLRDDVLRRVIENINSTTFDGQRCFDESRAIVETRLNKLFLNDFAESAHYRRWLHEKLVASNANPSLVDVLREQPLLAMFMEMLEEPAERRAIEFLIACESFERGVLEEEVSPAQALEDADGIFKRYFGFIPNSPTPPLFLSTDVKNRLENRLEGAKKIGNTRPPIDIFSDAKRELLRKLQQRHLSTFLRHPGYRQFAADLSSSLENGPKHDGGGTLKRTSSVNSLMSSISSQPTENSDAALTNGGSTKPGGRNLSVGLAQVDAFGRYRTLYDNESIFEKKGKLTRRLKQLVTSPRWKQVDEENPEDAAERMVREVRALVEAATEGGRPIA